MRNAHGLMIFAAGFGKRMGALTEDLPKPLVRVGGEALIDHALAVAIAAGADPVVVNLHYRGEQLAAHLKGRNVHLSWERDEILETGGGLRFALYLFDRSPVATLNSDAVWTGQNPLIQLDDAWDSLQTDALLLVAPVAEAFGHGVRADFAMDAAGALWRHPGGTEPGYVYLGAQILRTEGLLTVSERIFSLNRLWDTMIAKRRLFGLVHRGRWCDVGRPDNVAKAEALLHQAGHV